MEMSKFVRIKEVASFVNNVFGKKSFSVSGTDVIKQKGNEKNSIAFSVEFDDFDSKESLPDFFEQANYIDLLKTRFKNTQGVKSVQYFEVSWGYSLNNSKNQQLSLCFTVRFE